jgi:hypothetical protein
MNKTMAMAVFAVVFLVGCGGDRLRRDLKEDRAKDPTVTEPAQPLTVELRMRGAQAQGYDAVMLVPNRLEVVADGVKLPTEPTYALVDLARTGHAEKLATFGLPPGAKEVELRLELGAGGGFERPGKSGYLDTRRADISFKANADQLAKSGRLVVELDVSRSVVGKDASTRRLVPQFRVHEAN